MSKSLEGLNILVTGASGGIGAAVVERLAAEGARPIVHYGRDKAGAEALLARTSGAGWIVQGDLSTADGPFALWRAAVGAAGRVHGLVNNAGIRTEISIDASPDDWKAAWKKEFQINFFAAADLSKEAIRHFKANGGGRIVNMASRAGQRGYAADAMLPAQRDGPLHRLARIQIARSALTIPALQRAESRHHAGLSSRINFPVPHHRYKPRKPVHAVRIHPVARRLGK